MKIAFGPGAMVASAFVGPGTVTVCTLAGAGFGFSLLWALAFATLAAIALQDMAVRLGAGARLGVGEAMLAAFPGPVGATLVRGLALVAVAGGAAAYEAGNLTGAVIGVEAALGGRAPDAPWLTLAIGLSAGALLVHGEYRLLERVLIAAAGVMGLCFILTAVLTRPDLAAMARGLAPALPPGSAVTAAALIGTTVVPYNLFLHAAAARARWAGGAGDVQEARREARRSIALGGLISVAILASAAQALYGRDAVVESAADLARAAEPVFGPLARTAIGVGLAAAGLTSALTAPMAAGYAMAEVAGAVSDRTRDAVRRATAAGVLIIGVVVALWGVRPVALILIAQTANGVLLPLLAGVLLAAMNRRTLLGDHANGAGANIAGALATIFAFALGLRALARVFGAV